MANQVEHFLEKWRETEGVAELLARLVRISLCNSIRCAH